MSEADIDINIEEVTEEALNDVEDAFSRQPQENKNKDLALLAELTTDKDKWMNNKNSLDFPGVDTPNMEERRDSWLEDLTGILSGHKKDQMLEKDFEAVPDPVQEKMHLEEKRMKGVELVGGKKVDMLEDKGFDIVSQKEMKKTGLFPDIELETITKKSQGRQTKTRQTMPTGTQKIASALNISPVTAQHLARYVKQSGLDYQQIDWKQEVKPYAQEYDRKYYGAKDYLEKSKHSVNTRTQKEEEARQKRYERTTDKKEFIEKKERKLWEEGELIDTLDEDMVGELQELISKKDIEEQKATQKIKSKLSQQGMIAEGGI